MSGSTFKQIFTGKQDKLEDKIDTAGLLLGTLEAKNVITKAQRNTIEVNSATFLGDCFRLIFCRLTYQKYRAKR